MRLGTVEYDGQGAVSVRGGKSGSQYFTIFDAGARKGDYNDLPSVKYFLAGNSKRKGGINAADHGRNGLYLASNSAVICF